MSPDQIVISPGPCTPNEAGISMSALERFAGESRCLAFVSVCRAWGQVYGGDVIRASEVMHGKTSDIWHNGTGVFKDRCLHPFTATRYHSLVVDLKTLPDCFEVTAWTGTQEEPRKLWACGTGTLVWKGCSFTRSPF